MTHSLWVAFDSKINESANARSKVTKDGGRIHKRCKILRLDVMKIVNVPCSQTHFPLCQAPVKNCSMSAVQIAHSDVAACKSFWSEAKWKTTLEIGCLPGFSLQGPPRVICHANGSWSELPICSRKCLKPTTNGTLLRVYNDKKNYDVGEEILIVCVGGYVSGEKYLQSHFLATCQGGGKWSRLSEPIQCIPHKEVNCPAQVCQTIQLRIKEKDNATLPCYWNHTFSTTNNSVKITTRHSYWIKNHEKLANNSKILIVNDSRLEITEFEANDAGIYTCVQGEDEGEVERVIIYVVKVWSKCEIDDDDVMKTEVVREGKSVYLSVRGEETANVMNVAWFKNGIRIWGDKKKIILPNGDLIVYNARGGDEGFYTFEIEKEVDVCIDRTTRLVVTPQTPSICGLTEPVAPHPWLVTLWWERETAPFCYGSLVNERWIVTSSFCLHRFSRSTSLNMSVSLSFNRGSNSMGVERFIMHPNYSSRLNVNDIALIKLISPVVYNGTIRPICLSSFDFEKLIRDSCEVSFGFQGNVTGFGSLNVMDDNEISVKREEMLSVDNSKCQHQLVFSFPQSMFCAEPNQSSTTLIRRAGDNGSPFEVTWRGRVYLGGVFSWGERSSGIGMYDYFTKISMFYDWIQSKIKNV